MHLKKWLKSNRMTIAEFADQAGYSSGAVAKWVQGERFPRIRAIKKIEEITDGSVTVQDFFNQAQ